MASTEVAPAFAIFRAQVYAQVAKIPSGRVSTYGAIARAIPCPPGIDPLAYRRIRARWVGYALKSCPPGLPWWRVVNSRGGISPRPGFGPQLQRLLLAEEGVPTGPEGNVDLELHRWIPQAGEPHHPPGPPLEDGGSQDEH